MTPVFGSLGSNYTFGQAWSLMAALLLPPDPQTETLKLQQALSEYFPDHQSRAYFIQGRQAITAALRAHGIGAGAGVITQAFSCFAVVDAVRTTGATAVLADVAPDSTNMGLAEITAAAQTAQVPIRAVILQHGLGIAADEVAIQKWCRSHDVLLISDLAQGFGSRYADGRLVGTAADCIVLSFGRDKILDAVLGGALLCRTTPPHAELLAPFATLSRRSSFSPSIYPLLTILIRSTWQLGIGRLVLKLAVLLGLIASPVIDAAAVPTQLPAAHARLVRTRLATLPYQLEHRQQLAAVYAAHLPLVGGVHADTLELHSWVRFATLVENPARVLAALKKQSVYVTDRWYTKPLDAGSLERARNYAAGSCRHTETVTRQVVNLPTHQGVTPEQAEHVAEIVAKESYV